MFKKFYSIKCGYATLNEKMRLNYNDDWWPKRFIPSGYDGRGNSCVCKTTWADRHLQDEYFCFYRIWGISPYNESAAVLVDKSGVAVNDLIYFDFYHEYDNNENPLFDTENGAKIGMTGDCVYVDTNNLETTYIGDTAVILGSMSTPYKQYTAKFRYGAPTI